MDKLLNPILNIFNLFGLKSSNFGSDDLTNVKLSL